MSDEMIPFVKDHVVAISAYYQGKLWQHATGTLVRFSDHHFLVTAAHAIEDFHKGLNVYADLQLYIDNGNASNIVRLYGTYHATQIVRELDDNRITLPGERSDFWDIGLWELDALTIKSLTNKRFLNRHGISLTEDLTKGIYFLAGSPSIWARADSETKTGHWKWLRYVAHPYPERNELPNFDERFHMAICLGDDPTLPAELRGISGCPIWKLSDFPVADDWKPTEARLVAVQTCVYSDRPLKAIRGTKWRYVLPVLIEMHPEIRDIFNLWFPGDE
jgi:hypothetical protein